MTYEASCGRKPAQTDADASPEILKIILVENEAWRRVHQHWCELHQQHVSERADWRQAVMGLLRERQRIALAGPQADVVARQPSPEVAFANGVLGKDEAGLYQTMKEPEEPSHESSAQAQPALDAAGAATDEQITKDPPNESEEDTDVRRTEDA